MSNNDLRDRLNVINEHIEALEREAREIREQIEWRSNLVRARQQYNRVDAIKAIRAATHCSLRDAKDIVDVLMPPL